MQPPRDDAGRVQSILTLYRAAVYDARLPDGSVITLRIGERPPAEALAWIGNADLVAFVTAANPYSQPCTTAQNAQRMTALYRELHLAKWAYLRGDGYLPGESWREPSVLVKDLNLHDVDALGRRHDQNAVLVLRSSDVVKMRTYRADWRDLIAPALDLEWA